MRYVTVPESSYEEDSCPHCHSKVLWEDAFTEKDDWNWFGMTYWFTCPHCGGEWCISYKIDYIVLCKED